MYNFFKIWARTALFFYSRKTVTEFAYKPNFGRPEILASNHPNSFFDAIVIAVNYPKSIYFLARGDAFKKPMVANFLKALHLIPIYRLSEGKENLYKNDATFEICLQLLKNNQSILIFSEGICVNEWHLRPLKKGTARLVFIALEQKINSLIVRPININYTSFSKFPKDILINFNAPFTLEKLDKSSEIVFYKTFNETLKKRILEGMIVKNDLKDVELFTIRRSYFKLGLLLIPAILGFITQYWMYFIINKWVTKKTKNTVFYDSVLFGFLMLLYPVMVLLVVTILTIVTDFTYGLIVLIFLPFTAFCYKQFKNNL